MITIAAGRVGGHFETEDDTRVYAKAGCVYYTTVLYSVYRGCLQKLFWQPYATAVSVSDILIEAIYSSYLRKAVYSSCLLVCRLCIAAVCRRT